MSSSSLEPGRHARAPRAGVARRTIAALELSPGESAAARPGARRNRRRELSRYPVCSIRSRSFVVVPQLRIVMFLYSGFMTTLPMRLLVAFSVNREK